MPTPAEKKALAFLSLVILLGAGVRVLRAGAAVGPTEPEQQALSRQARAVDSAGNRPVKPRKGGKPAMRARLRRDGGADTVAGVAGVARSDVRPDPGGLAGFERAGWVNGFPPPSPRIDFDRRPAAARLPRDPGPGAMPGPASHRVDVDLASAAELRDLPRVGPALAARIIANRDSFGPFRSLDGLRRVKGVGPATLERLAPYVTFSGRPASFPASRRY